MKLIKIDLYGTGGVCLLKKNRFECWKYKFKTFVRIFFKLRIWKNISMKIQTIFHLPMQTFIWPETFSPPPKYWYPASYATTPLTQSDFSIFPCFLLFFCTRKFLLLIFLKHPLFTFLFHFHCSLKVNSKNLYFVNFHIENFLCNVLQEK